MTHKEIYDKFKTEYDKINITSSYPSLTDYEIAALLDRAYLALIAQKFTGNNMRRVGFEGDIKVTEDLAPLVTTVNKTKSVNFLPIKGVKNALSCSIPNDWLYYVSSSVKFWYTDSGVSKIKNLPARLIDHKTADRFYSTSYNMPWIKGAVCYTDAGYYSLDSTERGEQPQKSTLIFLYDLFEINLFLEGHSEHSESILLTYIRKPAMFLVDNSADTDDPGSTGDPEPGDEPGDDPNPPVQNRWVIGDIQCTKTGLNKYTIYTAQVDVDHGINVAYNYTTNATDVVDIRYEKISGSGNVSSRGYKNDGSLDLVIDNADATVKIIAYIYDDDLTIYKEKAFVLEYVVPKADSGLSFPTNERIVTSKTTSGKIYILNPNKIDVTDIDISVEGDNVTIDEVEQDSLLIWVRYNILSNGTSTIKAVFAGNDLYDSSTTTYTVRVNIPDEVTYRWSGISDVANLHFSDPSNVCQLPQIRLMKFVNGEYVEDVWHRVSILVGGQYCTVQSDGVVDTITITSAAKTLSAVRLEVFSDTIDGRAFVEYFYIYVQYTDTTQYTLNPITEYAQVNGNIYLHSRKTDVITDKNQVRWELTGEGDIYNYFTIQQTNPANGSSDFFYALILQIDENPYSGTKNINVKLSVIKDPDVYQVYTLADIAYAKQDPQITSFNPTSLYFINVGETKTLHLFDNPNQLPVTVTSDYVKGMSTTQSTYTDAHINVPITCHKEGSVSFTATFAGNDKYNSTTVQCAPIEGESKSGEVVYERVYIFAIGSSTDERVHPILDDVVSTNSSRTIQVASAGGLSMALMPLVRGTRDGLSIEVESSSGKYMLPASIRYSTIENYCILLYRIGWGGGTGNGYANSLFSINCTKRDVTTLTEFILKGGLDETESSLFAFHNPSQVVRVPFSGMDDYVHIYKYPHTFISPMYFEELALHVFDYRLFYYDRFGVGTYKSNYMSDYLHPLSYVNNFITNMTVSKINSIIDLILFSVSSNDTGSYRDALIYISGNGSPRCIHFIQEYESANRIYFMYPVYNEDYFDKDYYRDLNLHPGIIFLLGNSHVVDEQQYQIDIPVGYNFDIAYPKQLLQQYSVQYNSICTQTSELLWGNQAYIRLRLHNTSHTIDKFIFNKI